MQADMIVQVVLLGLVVPKVMTQCLIEVQPPSRRLQELPEVPIPQVPLPQVPVTPRLTLENLLDEEWRAFKVKIDFKNSLKNQEVP